MARQHANRPDTHRVTTIYRDEQGNEIGRAVYEERMVQEGNSLVSETVAENSVLASGEVHNPSMASGGRPVMLVGACALCGTAESIFPWRRRRTTRLTSLKQLRHCVDCGTAVCPNHRRQGKDRRLRCIRCHRRHVIKRFLRPIFYRQEIVE